MTAQNLAIALSSALNLNDDKVAGSATEVYIAHKDKQIRLKNRFASNIVVVDKATGLTTFTLNTDYIIDDVHPNFIKPVSGGGIADGLELSIAYDYAGESKHSLAGGLASFDMKVELIGLNKRTGKNQSVFLGNVTARSETSFNFLSKEFAKAEINGTANIDEEIGSPSYGFPYVIDFEVEEV